MADPDPAELLDLQFDRAGSQLTVYLSGEIDLATAPELVQRVTDELTPDLQMVWLDLAEVSFCDSSGLGAFVTLHRQVTDGLGARFVLYQPNQVVNEVLVASGVDQVITVSARPPTRPGGHRG